MSPDPNNTTIRFPDDTGRTLAEVLDTCPAGSVIELAPGRYVGSLLITRPMTLRGAGDLTRITSDEPGSVLILDGPPDTPIEVSSVLIEGGRSERGAGVSVRGGIARLFNVHVRHCEATSGGGALAVENAEAVVGKLRAHHVHAADGGAMWVGPGGNLVVEDSQLEDTEAKHGGAIFLSGRCRVALQGVTIRKSRAVTQSGGQAFYVRGDARGVPSLKLERVRLEDAPFGLPLVTEAERPPLVEVSGCDMPRIILDTPGVIDGGGNDWR